MERLKLTLKKQWFDMIKRGEKLEEYRELKEYWGKRFLLASGQFKQFDEIEFTLGYPKKDDNSRRIVFKNPHIRIDVGHVNWGAEAGKLYFVIDWRNKLWKQEK